MCYYTVERPIHEVYRDLAKHSTCLYEWMVHTFTVSHLSTRFLLKMTSSLHSARNRSEYKIHNFIYFLPDEFSKHSLVPGIAFSHIPTPTHRRLRCRDVAGQSGTQTSGLSCNASGPENSCQLAYMLDMSHIHVQAGYFQGDYIDGTLSSECIHWGGLPPNMANLLSPLSETERRENSIYLPYWMGKRPGFDSFM